MNEISMIMGEAKFLRYQDAIYAFWTDNLRLAGKGKTDKRANLFSFDRTICRFFNVILTQFLPQELTIPLMLSSNCLICRSLPALGCYFRQEIVIIAGLACVLFD